jgi:hypothetical protein
LLSALVNYHACHMNGAYHINVVKHGSSRVNLRYVYNLQKKKT